MICGCSVLGAKGHDTITIYTIPSVEGHLLSIISVHEDLVVARVCIHEAEEFMSCSGIHQLINLGKRVGILRA